ncbi:MAG: hypothetical protein M3Y17_06720 [Actinomycetota bacterium]|nr:hypothetical protein [Actinomycetota bacterium]
MSAPLVHFVTPGLELLDAAIDDPPALGCEVAEARDVFPKALRLTRHAHPEVAPRWEGRGPAAAVRELLCEAFAARGCADRPRAHFG